MIHEEKKIGKIVEEMTMFFFAVGAKNMETKIERIDNEVKITFHSDYNPEYENTLLNVEQYLLEPKNEGMEDMYWELAGTGEPGESDQLLLVGMMIDRYEFHLEEGKAEFVFYRELERVSR